MVAQVAALDHSNAFSALTLVSTRPVAPGPVDDDLPDHDAATMDAVFSRPMPDWTDRSAVAAFAADGAELLGNDPEQARATAARIWDRTPSSEPSVQQANQLGMVFARLAAVGTLRLADLDVDNGRFRRWAMHPSDRPRRRGRP